MNEKKYLIYLSVFAFFVATLPIFFEIYRTAAFNTTPRDDYAPFLQAMIGKGGFFPEAPGAYRVFSVAVAIPFFYLLPTFKFSQLPYVDPTYLKATQALCFTSYLSVVLTGLVIFFIARKRYQATKASALIAALASFFVGSYLERFVVDPVGVLVISLLVLVINRPVYYVPLILVAIGFNEKITLVFSTLFAFRFMHSMVKHQAFHQYPQLIASIVALLSYFVIRLFLVKIPGFEQQITPSMYLENIHHMIVGSLSMKGLYLNLLPTILQLFIFYVALQYKLNSRNPTTFQVTDISSLLVLFAAAVTADVGNNVGRVIMYTLPLYLPAITPFIDDILKTEPTLPTTNQPMQQTTQSG